MTRSTALQLTLAVGGRVSALLEVPAAPRACYVFAHGAGAGMQHRFMQQVSEGFLERGIATLRFQFPYMERGSRRTDPPPLCHSTVRAAVAAAATELPGVPLVAGGRSFGGRMSSQAQALEALPQVQGLLFLGFPLHPAGDPGIPRAEHLKKISIPMLFVQGDHDKLAQLPLLEPLVVSLGGRATLALLAGADHGFHVPARSGRTDAQVLVEALDSSAQWIVDL